MLTRRKFTGMCGALPFMKRSKSYSPDPYSLSVPAPFVSSDPNPNFFPDWNNPNGKEAVDLRTLAGKTIVLVIISQSNGTNVMPSLYVPSNRLGVINFNIGDGNAYRAKPGGPIDPLLGCTGFAPNLPNGWPNGNWPGILADSLISDGTASNVVVVPIGVGGSYAADWAVGGSNNIRITVTARRLSAAGLTPDAVLWNQGESDYSTPYASYVSSITSAIGTVHSYWPTVPVFVAIQTYIHGLFSSTIATAQAAVVNPAAHIFAGANADSLVGINRQSDLTHWSDVGGANLASLIRAKLHAYGAPF